MKSAKPHTYLIRIASHGNENVNLSQVPHPLKDVTLAQKVALVSSEQ